MDNYIQLKQFKQDDLLFNEEETRIILKFIFKPADHELIDSMPMSDYLRGFSQGLLVEAIDASYAIGYVKSLFVSTANPTKGAITIIKKFGKKAAQHWFKNASSLDLQNVKIYDFIIDNIARTFRSRLRDFLASNNINSRSGAFIAYQTPMHGMAKRWG